jgi:hypothetical protein
MLSRWKNYFFQLWNLHCFSNVRQIEIYTAESLVLGASRHNVENAIETLKKCKSQGSDEIPQELIQVGGEVLLSEIRKLTVFE